MARDTSHLIVETVGGRWFIVSSLANRKDTQLFTIERYTGRLIYNAQPGIDLFQNPRDAIQYISMGKKIKLKNVISCHALIGYYICGSNAYILIATKVSADLTLPPAHKVYTIQETQWIRIPLGYPIEQGKSELKNAETMTDFPLNGLHFYCETLDLTRRFPSVHSPTDYDPEFCWNDFLSKEFQLLGMRHWCCILLEGLAVGHQIQSKDNPDETVNIAIITRRSCLNPGTRYHSRGLNSKGSPGNEYEFEQLLWKTTKDSVNWTSMIWRRGTVPLHWKSKINVAVQVTDAEIVIDDQPYEKVDVYYKRLVDRYKSKNITCLNLLRTRQHNPDEGLLSMHFQESLKVVKKLTNVDVNLVNYDWHSYSKQVGLNKTVEQLWAIMGSKLSEVGFTTGVLRLNEKRELIDSKIVRKQDGVIRVNCADSLDRTNLVLFLLTLQTVIEQCRTLGIKLNLKKDMERNWSTLDKSLDEIREIYDRNILLKIAEMFVQNGDVCSTLLTNTAAMHTSTIREFAQHLPPAPSNAQLLVERRYQNVVKDNTRQTQYEMFLGLNWDKYFPAHQAAIKNGRLRYCTPYPAYIFKALPSALNIKSAEEVCLLSNGSKYFWVCPKDFDFVEFHVILPFYCRVTELAITVRHGVANESSSPTKMDVFVGTHIDDCSMGFQEMIIPRCEDGTKLLYSLPPQVSGIVENCKLYDFEGRVASSKMRVVRVTFYGIPEGAQMTLGQVQVFGIQEENDKPPKQFQINLREERSAQKVKKTIEKEQKEGILLDFDAMINGKQEGEKNDQKENKETQENKQNETSTVKVDTTTETTQSSEKKEDTQNKVEITTNSTSSGNNSQNNANSKEDNNKTNNTTTVESDVKNTTDESTETTRKSVRRSRRKNLTLTTPFVDDYFAEKTLKLSDLDRQSVGYYNGVFTVFKVASDLSRDEESLSARGERLNRAKDKYIKFLKSKCKTPEDKISFTDALELDLARLKLHLTPQQRDLILVNLGYKVANFDPNRFLFYRDEKIEAAIRKKCKTNHCYLCGAGVTFRSYACRYCRYTYCKACTAKDRLPIIEYMWTKPQRVCMACSEMINHQKQMLKEIQEGVKAEEKRQIKNLSIHEKLFSQLYPAMNIPNTVYKGKENVLISEFPAAAILSSVETADTSPPIESILFSPDVLSKDLFWFAPQDVQRVNIIIVLPCYAKISMISLIVDASGYYGFDLPEIKLATAERLPEFKEHGIWELCDKSDAPLSKQLIQPFERIDYKFKQDGTVCRLIKMELRLPKIPEDSDFTPMLHLGRVMVFGELVPPPFSLLLSPEDNAKYNEILKIKQRTTRVQLKIEEEKYDKDKATLEMRVSGQYVSGFRLNIKHSPGFGIQSQVKELRVSLLSKTEKGEFTQQVVGQYTIPKVSQGTSLCYDFPQTYERVEVARFEFLSNYGARETCPSKIFLYVNTVATSTQ